ncbi:YbaB/EbfC family nucleoid-associated protein [Saccharopolyspora pogona]|uniref:YbaB/EbfC family nucleoid-associated protein n=1 Tax=Saccharopolyspora pogona TaxID=333966 RepID=UPI001CC25BCC|nr:YbaB/EbfC family nucleoid-associated protein [Saccharopolyspora pogona]
MSDPDVESILIDLERKKNLMHTLREEAAASYYTGTSDDRAVVATVNGLGKLHDLSIPDKELRSSHPSTLGGKIVAAINAARAQAIDDSNAKLIDALPGFGS